MKPLVSILIPTYNRPHYFKQALNSALMQTYPNIEIIVSDNSDNDKTKRIVKTYQSRPKGTKIKYVRNKSNIGPIANQQQCFDLSTGEYINYLMDDDLFHPRKIEKMMKYFLQYKNISLVTSQRRVIDADGKPIYIPPLWTFKRLYSKDTIVGGRELSKKMIRDKTNYIGEPTTALFRKKDLEEPFGVLLGKQVYFAVDAASWLSLLTKGKAVYIVEPLSYLRYHNKQLSQHKYAKEVAKLDTKVFKHFIKMKGFLEDKNGDKKK